MIRQSRYEEFRDSINSLIEEYREKFTVPHITNWPEYERKYRERNLGIARDLRSDIERASSHMFEDEFGRPSILRAEEKVFIILAKEVMRLSNRRTAYLMPLMGLSHEISYKTVERLYSDPLVIMILNNMFVLSVRDKGIAHPELTGDGTGYSLTVTKHYRSIREKSGEKVKKGQFVYSFALMDLKTRMYVGYAVSLRSERDAYHRALEMIRSMNIEAGSVRLDRYYSGQSILDDFSENTRIFIIPKKNSRIRGSKGWHDIIKRFMSDPMEYLKEYFRRSNSEAEFSSDKRLTGGIIRQRRNDRIEIAGFCKGLIHNLMLLKG